MFTRLIFFLILLWPAMALAQSPPYIVLGEQELSGVHIYSLIQGEDEIIYAATNSGLYAFRHQKFVNLKSSPKQKGSSLFDLRFDHDGRLFCCNLSGQVFQLDGDSLQLIYEAPPEDIKTWFSYFFDDDNDLVVVDRKITKLTSSGPEIISDLTTPSKLTPEYFPVQPSGEDNYFFSNAYYRVPSLIYANSKWEEVQVGSPESLELGEIWQYFEMGEHHFLISSGGQVSSIEGVLASPEPLESDEKYYWISSTELLAVNKQRGVRMLTPVDGILTTKASFLPNTFISAATLTNAGSLLLGTFNQGVLLIPDYTLLKIPMQENSSAIAAKNDEEAFLCLQSGHIYYSNKDGLMLLDSVGWNLNQIFAHNQPFTFPGMRHERMLFNNSHDLSTGLKDMQDSGDRIYLATYLGVLVVAAEKAEILRHHPDAEIKEKEGAHYSFLSENFRCNSVHYDSTRNTLYYGDSQRTYMSREGADSAVLKYDGVDFLSVDLTMYDDVLICGTSKHGLLFFREGKLIRQWDEATGLFANSIKKVDVKAGQLFVLSQLGLQVIDLEKEQLIDVGIAEGLDQTQLIDFSLGDEFLWLLEKDGFYTMPVSNVNDRFPPPRFYVDSIVVSGMLIDPNSTPEFSYRNNSIGIYVDVRSPETIDETYIQYRLLGSQEEWKTLSPAQHEIEFLSLAPNEYTCQIKAVYRGVDSEVFEFRFMVRTPFWEQWWFYLLVGLLLAIGIGLFYRRRLRKEARIANQLRELNASRLAAIQSQMNPHFIFNSLNSIQHLVLQGDTDNSYAYITKFANLVRRTLDYSDKEMIPLEDEFKLLEVYLNLEKLRFKEELEYELIAPERMDVQVPPMLIQPFIENALVHGLLHKKGTKKLKVAFTLNDALHCVIEDNGIGRERAREIRIRQRGDHHSFSLNAIRKRFQILKEYHDDEIGYEYEDFDPETSEVVTRVTVRIPVVPGKET